MLRGALLTAATAGLLAASAVAQPSSDRSGSALQPPEHTAPYPDLGSGKNRKERAKSYDLGPQLQRGIPARELLDQRRRLDRALAGLSAQTPGVIDAYVVSVALDSDPVFAREAREAARVLSRRYSAQTRTLTLAGPDGKSDDLAQGSIDALIISLARIAEIMDPEEDVLILYSTSHGLQLGLAYHYGDSGYGVLSPVRFKSVLEELGIKRRVLILSACYAGVFVEPLGSPNTAILTAAAATRTSFGCRAENDWTFFGDALINNALRQPQSLDQAGRQAASLVANWEVERRLLASLPQMRIGSGVSAWLSELENRMPKEATQPVGRPAISE